MRLLLGPMNQPWLGVKKLRLIGSGQSLVKLLIAAQGQPVLDFLIWDRNYSGSDWDHGKARQLLVDPAFHVKERALLLGGVALI
jgi:hypothetical protein